MNAELDPGLVEKLKALSPERRAEVADFVDFLALRERADALEDFQVVADRVARAGVPALSPEQIEGEITALRAARRSPAR